MIERVLATIYVRIYENQGKMLGFISTIIVWSLIALFGLYVYLSSIEDVNTFSYPLPFLTLTSIYNSEILIFIHLFFLFLVVCISVADYFLIHRNLKIKSNFFSSITTYNLSKSYQAKQNILVMKIIFPLDFSYTFVYVIYNILSTIVRLNKDEYGQLVYIRNYEMINLVDELIAFIII
uniref:7TM_GPCR_Srx domain-containing protein n=1 Tax=Meloidogyne hapla TaxID=6305 RepID=A0A1I8BPC9_MELHA